LRETDRHVDLPLLFKEYLDGGIPDRRLFLDYCHLTTEGIQVAMGAAASWVLRELKGVDISWPALVSDDIAPSREIEAEASFLAAIMNGHSAQSYDVVHYFCARTLTLSRHAAELMLNYIDFQTRRLLPMRMTEAEERIAKSGSSLMQRYLLRLNQKRLDKLLLDAIVNALADVGIDALERLEQLRCGEHSVVSGEIDLLEYYYCSASDQEQELAWVSPVEERRYRPDADYYRAYWPESRFVFVGEAGSRVALLLTCRLPAKEGVVRVLVNGKPQVEMVVNTDWSSWTINLEDEIVRDGLNEVAVRWPVVDVDNSGWIESVRQRVCERKFPEFYPIFGEIHTFRASSPRQISNTPAVEQELTEAVA